MQIPNLATLNDLDPALRMPGFDMPHVIQRFPKLLGGRSWSGFPGFGWWDFREFS